MLPVVLLSLFAVSAVAQSNTTTSANTTNPLIPSNISDDCKTYLISLNQDASLATCTSSLINSTAAFAPSANGTRTTSQIKSALATLCDDSKTGCSESDIRSQLSKFLAACTAELTGDASNDDVRKTYDILYTITPFKNAVCSTDASGQYCVLQIATPPEIQAVSSTASAKSKSHKTKTASGQSGTASATGTDSSASASASPTATGGAGNNYAVEPPKVLLGEDDSAASLASAIKQATDFLTVPLTGDSNAARLRLRDGAPSLTTQSPIGLAPNTTTFSATSLLYLFTLPSFSEDKLCTNCTSAVMSGYASWEAETPYAGGLVNSPMLAGQMSLWQNVKDKCGETFYDNVLSGSGASPHGNGTVSLSGATAVSDVNFVVMLGALALGVFTGF